MSFEVLVDSSTSDVEELEHSCAEVEERNTTIGELKAQITKLQAPTTEVNRTISKLKSEIERRDTVIGGKLNAQITVVQKELEHARAEVEGHVRTEVEERDTAIGELKAQISELQEELAELK
ncbi:hypothetical protein BC936DRAFT_138165 [Jimgerdemannia flammicorona]|uniref:Uncharacterized protein n=1 Tax=Jimgerdemannia flammicorona TaxID=994334 RepID=A0A433CVQ3_9FUNG|nr:hypothetical protein BC936DRAFT_138165 [Jimgerdemannia flammicorona]